MNTPAPCVKLAGDFVRTSVPSALMERATVTGFLAANQLLDRWNVRGETVRSVPPRGPLATLARYL